MKVIMLKHPVGKVVDLPEGDAKKLIKKGMAKAHGAKEEKPKATKKTTKKK